jgi:eukaryotic-like serine/threonine-protein kinase
MNSTSWEKVKEVFALALEQPRERRAEFLRGTCGVDPELLGEVESLLEAHDESRPVLERKDFGVATLFDATGAGYEGKQFGHYKVIRELGRGGMGAVFLAERADGEFHQQVALKIVRRTFADTELTRRFRRERQILASLNHPNIARLLDGGVSQDGEPYLVMEYVEGSRIDEYCDRRGLSTDARLRLFLAVCRGVSYAHQNLVVHRDIKPSNVLVTKEGVPKLLDFGIAKLLDQEHADERTETSFRAFTPEYASPEQVRGEQITTGSDVYTLGVLLHGLLHGVRRPNGAQPAAGRWRAESSGQKTVATNLPTKQEGGNGEAGGRLDVGGELRNIVAMARREEPARRYSSVAQFAEDVQRYLEGLPVRAQKDSFTYRAGKFVRRHQVGVGAAAVVLLSLVVGLALALWQASVARRERDRAERRFGEVRQLSNALLTDIAPKIERLEGSTDARQALVTQSLKYLDSLAQESGDDLLLQSELATAYEKIGDLQGAPGRPNLSDFTGALTSLGKAQAIRLNLLGKNPRGADNQKRLAASLSASSYIRWWTSDVSGSIKDSERALELYSKLIAADPASVELRAAAAEARLNLAQTYYFNDQTAETYPPLRSALTELEALRRADDRNTEIGRLLSKGYVLLGNTFFWDNKPEEGEAEIVKALALGESLAAENPNDAVVRQGLWHVYIQSSQFYQDSNPARSSGLLAKALRVAEESAESDPANTQARQNLAKTYSMLGVIATRLKKLDESAAYLEKSLAVFADLERAEPLNLTYKDDIGLNLVRLGQTKYQQRDYAVALATYDRAIPVLEYQARDPKNLFPLRRLSTVHAYIGDIHRDLAKTSAGEEGRAHGMKARENYQRALDLLLQLQAQNALQEYDRKVLEEMQEAVRKLS